ncbi:MAG: DoxX family protein [Chloroflexota bacterium]
MKYLLIAVQILVALAFIAAGAFKIFTPVEQLVEQMSWVTAVPAFAVPVIGILELAGGLGLILPWLTGIQPQLVSLAAIGLVLTMIGAVITHVAIGDPAVSLISPTVLGLLAAFVAYGRRALVPLS